MFASGYFWNSEQLLSTSYYKNKMLQHLPSTIWSFFVQGRPIEPVWFRDAKRFATQKIPIFFLRVLAAVPLLPRSLIGHLTNISSMYPIPGNTAWGIFTRGLFSKTSYSNYGSNSFIDLDLPPHQGQKWQMSLNCKNPLGKIGNLVVTGILDRRWNPNIYIYNYIYIYIITQTIRVSAHCSWLSKSIKRNGSTKALLSYLWS